jgi:hypothetical protein
MVVIHSQTLGIGVIPEQLAVDAHPRSVVGFPQEVEDFTAE